MKKQYILMVLLLMGFGVVSTMAFSVSPLTNEIALYEATGISTDVTVSSVEINAYGENHVKIKLTLASTDNANDAVVSVVVLSNQGTELTWDNATNVSEEYGIGEEPSTAINPGVSAEILSFNLDGVALAGTDYVMFRIKGPGVTLNIASVFVQVKDSTGLSDTISTAST